MKEEYIDVFDEDMNLIGCQERNEVHKNGFWHQTFHCWIVQKEAEKNYVIFQIRQNSKKIFPGLYDVSCGGHLLEGESPQDGIREIEEELGIKVNYNELIYIGMCKTENKGEDYIDREFTHVYLYLTDRNLDAFHIDTDEVSGLIRVPIDKILDLFYGKILSVKIDGFKYSYDNELVKIGGDALRSEFVPISNEYCLNIIDKFIKLVK